MGSSASCDPFCHKATTTSNCADQIKRSRQRQDSKLIKIYLNDTDSVGEPVSRNKDAFVINDKTLAMARLKRRKSKERALTPPPKLTKRESASEETEMEQYLRVLTKRHSQSMSLNLNYADYESNAGLNYIDEQDKEEEESVVSSMSTSEWDKERNVALSVIQFFKDNADDVAAESEDIDGELDDLCEYEVDSPSTEQSERELQFPDTAITFDEAHFSEEMDFALKHVRDLASLQKSECVNSAGRQEATGSFVPVLYSHSRVDGQSLPDTTRLFISLFYALQQHGSALCIEILQHLFSQLCDQKRGQNPAMSAAAVLIDFDYHFVVTIEGDVSPLVALAKQYYSKWSMKQLPATSADSALSTLSMECADEFAELEEMSGYDRSQFSSFSDALLVERGIPCFPELPIELLESSKTGRQNVFVETFQRIRRLSSHSVFLNLVGTDV